MNYLQKPEAVYKRNNVIIAYKFDDKLIAKKEELIELYINRVVFIKGVYIATRKGKKYFTTFRDDNAANNLSSLPSISKEDMDSIYYDD